MSSGDDAGLFDGMVFYVHSEGRTYEGSGNLLVRIKEEIMTNGGDIEYSPENPSVTHILVPPDKEIKARDSDKSSLVNLHSTRFHKPCQYDPWATSAIHRARLAELPDSSEDKEYFMKRENERRMLSLSGDWDIPKLLEHFGHCISATNHEEIRGAEKPVLRYGWVRKCVEYGRVLEEEDDDWGGQILRGRVFETIRNRIPRYHSENQPLMIQDTEMSGRKISQEHLEFAKNMSSGSRHQQVPGPSTSYQPRDRTESDGHASKPHANRWDHLARHTYPSTQHVRNSESDTRSHASHQVAKSRSVAFDIPPTGCKQSSINKLELKLTDSSSRVQEQDDQKVTNIPLTPISLGNSPPPAPKPLSSVPTLAADPRKPVEPAQPPSEKRSDPNSASSSKPTSDELFVHDNIPLTFAVYGDNYTMEHCIKAGGGRILPPDQAQYLILPRARDQSNPKPELTKEEEQIMNEVAQRGGRQRVVSSSWIERCLKKQRLSAYQEYIIARTPAAPRPMPSQQETKDVGGRLIAQTPSEEANINANGSVTSSGTTSETHPSYGKKRSRDYTPPLSPTRKRRKVERSAPAQSTDDHHSDAAEYSHPSHDPADSAPRTPVGQPVRVDEIEEGISLLAGGLREWDLTVISRTRFLIDFIDKHDYQDWPEFFKKHERRILSRFRGMGYTYLHEEREKGC